MSMKVDQGFGKPHMKEGQISDLRYKEIMSIFIASAKQIFSPIDSFLSKYSNVDDSYVMQSSLSGKLLNMIATIFKLKKNETPENEPELDTDEEKLLDLSDLNSINPESHMFKFINKIIMSFGLKRLERLLEEVFLAFVHYIEEKRHQALQECKNIARKDYAEGLISLLNYNTQKYEIQKNELLLKMIMRDNLKTEIKSLKVALEEEVKSHDEKMQSYKEMKKVAVQDYVDEMMEKDIIVNGKKLNIPEEQKKELIKGIALIKAGTNNELDEFIANQKNGSTGINGTTFKSYQIEAGKKRILDNGKEKSVNHIMKLLNVDQKEAKEIYDSYERVQRDSEKKLVNNYKLADKLMAKEVANHAKKMDALQSQIQYKQEQLKELENKIKHNQNELPAVEVKELNTLMKERNNEDITKSSEVYQEFYKKDEGSIQEILDDLGIDNLEGIDLGEIKLDDIECTSQGIKMNKDRQNKEVDVKPTTPSLRTI